jgi:hypothetical protein
VSIHIHRPFAAVVGGILVVGPFIVWFFIYCASKFTSLDLKKLLDLLPDARVITWAAAVVLMFLAVVSDNLRFLFVYGSAMFAFSAGLNFSQSWLRKKLGLASDAD